MTNKTTLLILFLFLVTCGLLYLAITSSPVQKKAALTPTPTPMSVNAKSTLSLITASATESSKTASNTVAIVVDGTNNVNAVQIELSFDPKAITNVAILPGTFFKQPTVLLKNIDTANGRISYALAEQLDIPGHVGKGTVALLTFDTIPSMKPMATPITFLPKTAVTADKILESVLKKTQDITIQLPITTPTGTSSGSAVGAPL